MLAAVRFEPRSLGIRGRLPGCAMRAMVLFVDALLDISCVSGGPPQSKWDFDRSNSYSEYHHVKIHVKKNLLIQICS
ncbi:hypothetical protein P5V15_003027 [Pogonomyrmex californicus]